MSTCYASDTMLGVKETKMRKNAGDAIRAPKASQSPADQQTRVAVTTHGAEEFCSHGQGAVGASVPLTSARRSGRLQKERNLDLHLKELVGAEKARGCSRHRERHVQRHGGGGAGGSAFEDMPVGRGGCHCAVKAAEGRRWS